MPEPPHVHVDLAPSRCPYCHDALETLTDLVACAACGARHHTACYREHRACASCAGTAVLLPQTLDLGADLRARLDTPPEGACFEVEKTADGVAVSWPLVPAREVRRLLLASLLLTPILGVGLVFLLYYLFNRKSWHTVELTPEVLRSRPRDGVLRGVFGVERTRRQVTHVRLSDAGVVSYGTGQVTRTLATSGGFGNVLSQAEVEWLTGVLTSWHRGSLELCVPQASSPGAKCADRPSGDLKRGASKTEVKHLDSARETAEPA